jgi:hypothetical protein
VWEGEKLRAVLCDVRGFRDLSIPLARKVESETGSSTWTSDDATATSRRNEKREIEEPPTRSTSTAGDIPF